MKWILTIAAVLLAIGLVGCSSDPVGSNTQESQVGTEERLVLGSDIVDSGKDVRIEAALGATYASGVIPWRDQIEGDDDWMAVFYLPYNPGTVYFYARLRTGQWQPFCCPPWIQLHDARWTSSGFRVMVFMGDKMTDLCGISPSSYRLQY